MNDDERAKPISPITAMLLGMAAGLADSVPRTLDPAECERCHQRGFHASGCYYVVGWAYLEHYKHCRKCKPGVDVDGPSVLCPRGLRLHDKAKAASREERWANGS